MPAHYCPTCGEPVYYIVYSKCHHDELAIYRIVGGVGSLTTYTLDQLIQAWDVHLASSFREERSRLDEQSSAADKETPVGNEDPLGINDLWGQRLAELETTKQVLCNLFVVALYHIFEQNFVGFIRPPAKKPGKATLEDADIYFQDQWNIHFKQFSSWGTISWLEQAANAVKHGEGMAAEALRKSKPAWFSPPTVDRIVTPLGDDYLILLCHDFCARL
jgi:hypothetical protein